MLKRKPKTYAETNEQAQQPGKFKTYFNINPGVVNIVCDVPLCNSHCMRGTIQSDDSLIEGIITAGWRIDDYGNITCKSHS